VQHVRVEVVRPEVLERARERLRNLVTDARLAIVGQPVILPVDEGELGLEKEALAAELAARERLLHGRADAGLVVVLALVGGVDADEAGGERERRQLLRPLLLPRGAVEEARRAGA
jgi:hypothetical protein